MKNPFEKLSFISGEMTLSNDAEYKKTFTFKNLTKKDCENIQEIFVEVDYMSNEIKRLRKENAELRAFIQGDR